MKPSQSRPFQIPQPPSSQRTIKEKNNPSKRKTRLLKVKSDGVDLDAILESAKSGNIARPALPVGKFAWDMSSPVADQKRIIRQKEIDDERIETKPNSNPLTPRQRRDAKDAVQTIAMETATEKLFSCSPMPSPQNSPRQGTLKASPIRSSKIDFNLDGSLNLTMTVNSTVGGNGMNGIQQLQSPNQSPMKASLPYQSPQSPLQTPRSLASAKNGKQPALEPAVMVAFVRDSNTFGSPPRRVAVERKRVEYEQQSITELLLQAEINISAMLDDIARVNDEQEEINKTTKRMEETTPTYASKGGLSKNLPLDIFDNMDFEMYQPSEWIRRVSIYISQIS
jgi:hypothetical protein